MTDYIFNSLSEALYANFWLATLASFGWGVLSIILSPCHLSSIPLIVGFLSSQGEPSLARNFKMSLVFSIGILITIAIIGGVTLALGGIMGDLGSFGNYFVAVVFFVVGLYLLDVLKLPWDGARIGATKRKGYLAALVLGLLFGIGLGPCAFAFMAPVLGVVFQVSSTDTPLAASLLSAFSLGHIIIIVFAGALATKVQLYLNWTSNSNAAKYFKRVCGVLVILGGVYLIYKAG